MPLNHLVAELDALIGRWSAARELLASTLPTKEAGAPRSVSLAAVPDAGSSAAFAAEPQTPSAGVQVKVLKPRKPRERRSAARQRPAVASALSGSVPQGPVAVSPRDLRRAVVNEAVAATPAPARGALDDLVAEVARRTSGQGISANA